METSPSGDRLNFVMCVSECFVFFLGILYLDLVLRIYNNTIRQILYLEGCANTKDETIVSVCHATILRHFS